MEHTNEVSVVLEDWEEQNHILRAQLQTLHSSYIAHAHRQHPFSAEQYQVTILFSTTGVQLGAFALDWHCNSCSFIFHEAYALKERLRIIHESYRETSFLGLTLEVCKSIENMLECPTAHEKCIKSSLTLRHTHFLQSILILL
jgi:hypothetical protein